MKRTDFLEIATLPCFFLISSLAFGAEPTPDPLFHIERNKNANIVQYDAQVGPDGQLYAKEPVVAYWIRNAHDGEIKELTWVQEKLAYGFKVKLDKNSNSARVDMAADIGRSLVVKRNGDDYRAVATINDVESFIDKIFIQASGSGASTRVEYIELFGSAVTNNQMQYEQFTP